MSLSQIFSKIIFGGQTGADQGALDAALELNHPCGGWCPKGRKSEAGPIPDKYPVQEHPSGSYPIRTEANIKDSDGTLIFTYGKPSGGTGKAVEYTDQHRKPIYIIDLEFDPINVDPKKVWEWGCEKEVFTLNVAGPRESKQPGIQTMVKGIMT